MLKGFRWNVQSGGTTCTVTLAIGARRSTWGFLQACITQPVQLHM